MSTPEPYKPCPCGSGEKYKFCCKPKDKFKGGSPSAPEVEDSVGEPIGIADAMVAYAEPLLEQAQSEEEFQKAMTLAMVCWNASLLSGPERDRLLEKFHESVEMTPDQFAAFRHGILDPMIQRRLELFPKVGPQSRQWLRNERDTA